MAARSSTSRRASRRRARAWARSRARRDRRRLAQVLAKPQFLTNLADKLPLTRRPNRPASTSTGNRPLANPNTKNTPASTTSKVTATRFGACRARLEMGRASARAQILCGVLHRPRRLDNAELMVQPVQRSSGDPNPRLTRNGGGKHHECPRFTFRSSGIRFATLRRQGPASRARPRGDGTDLSRFVSRGLAQRQVDPDVHEPGLRTSISA
jgi:hypothetical protein